MASLTEHALQYRAGLIGFGQRRAEPGWACSCGEFWFRAQAMPRRKTGNNKIEAERAFAAHARGSGADSTDG